MKAFELPTLDPASLVGFHEDKLAWKRFERRFRLPSFIGVILVFGAPAAHMLHKIPKNWVVAPMACGIALGALSLFWAFKSTPLSSSGRPMKKYWNAAPKPGNSEIIYVCEESKTYFIRVWTMPSGSTD